MCMSNEELVKIIEEDNETEKMKQIQSVPKDVNLTNIGDITSLVKNYVALGCILEFDDNFLLIFSFTRYNFFFNKEF